MFEGLANALGGEGIATVVVAILAIAAVVIILYFLVALIRSLAGGGRLGGRGAGAPRLAVLDVAQVDQKRQLVLVRRDEVEHLVLVGGPNDLVVEAGITRLPVRQRRVEPSFQSEPQQPAEPAPRPVELRSQAPVTTRVDTPQPASSPSAPPVGAPPVTAAAAPLRPARPASAAEGPRRTEPPLARPAPAPSQTAPSQQAPRPAPIQPRSMATPTLPTSRTEPSLPDVPAAGAVERPAQPVTDVAADNAPKPAASEPAKRAEPNVQAPPAPRSDPPRQDAQRAEPGQAPAPQPLQVKSFATSVQNHKSEPRFTAQQPAAQPAPTPPARPAPAAPAASVPAAPMAEEAAVRPAAKPEPKTAQEDADIDALLMAELGNEGRQGAPDTGPVFPPRAAPAAQALAKAPAAPAAQTPPAAAEVPNPQPEAPALRPAAEDKAPAPPAPKPQMMSLEEEMDALLKDFTLDPPERR